MTLKEIAAEAGTAFKVSEEAFSVCGLYRS